MNYFSQILNGNIPSSVINSITDFQKKYNLGKNFSYLQLTENMSNLEDFNIESNEIINSPFSKYINMSLKLDRQKLGNGLMSILKKYTADAITTNKDDIQNMKLLRKNQIVKKT